MSLTTQILITAAIMPMWTSGMSAQVPTHDPLTLPIQKYRPPDFKRVVVETENTRIANVNAVLPAILDAIKLPGFEQAVEVERSRLPVATPDLYSRSFSSEIGDQEGSIQLLSISLSLRVFPTYTEAELGQARILAFFPVNFPRGTYSGVSIGELCYRANSGRSAAKIHFLRKNVTVSVGVSYTHRSRVRGVAAPVREPIDPKELVEEVASKVDRVLESYLPTQTQRK